MSNSFELPKPSETGERQIFGPDLVTEAEDKVKLIQANLKAAQSR
jgi:hypothetical protein